MAGLNKSIRINASPAKVFDVVTNPENWTRYVTSLVAVKDLSANAPASGSTFRWEYKMMGVKFSGSGEVTEHSRGKSFGLKLRGKASIDEAYQFIKNEDGSTTLKIAVKYEMPSEVLQVIMDSKLVAKLNSIESQNVLKKIKAMCEA